MREKNRRYFRTLAREYRSPVVEIDLDGGPIAERWRVVSDPEFSISEICSTRLGSQLVETGGKRRGTRLSLADCEQFVAQAASYAVGSGSAWP